MRASEAAFKEKDASIAVVGLGDAKYAGFFREKTGIDFPLLIDDKREAYKTVGLKHANLLHLLRKDNAQARRRAQAAGHKQHKLGKDPFQLGGSFVFAPGNKDLFVHVSETFGDNANPKDILAALG
ncbi:MAG TPA: peroxiredoxin-like family protein [Candidatus Angelobacter sp.]|nr:peroxiredoxin-like family protein [Candidatus Angelobacter sp.]